ncbi:MAG TPA: GNVR domain-containing protein [Accumulibacter sp.]|uniref:Chain length-determining protein n=2 Tax=Candidatus Accumulibacter TaxID=327159 RepID=A0A080M9M4_9PROT|nr:MULTISPECIES: XrtA system polysaccharide chain length determinant [Candidatus Accumulibacter]KFB78002.1 MAG: Tyrosine-protein kinase etk [Candidatus Accumulibacter cognatus]MCC2869909.1 chain length-determining protein [Candidatus Accumulibacter phosphatis]MCM8620664.1 Wzz/FepE/Etk N-terminal domain-containing protein [Accumulibacter sp.]MCQ1549926.1 Wzz/FepE/Etk N-terminal domain-containing protein [Candidatus Accumulibacter phosphatis]QLH50314.1 MAG: chain length-determining protein [Cand
MDELLRQATAILRGMWQRRWLGIIVAWVVGAASVAAVLAIPDKYEASARIFVDTQSILRPLMAGLVTQPNVDQQVMMLSRTLITRPNVEKLIRMADLDLKIDSKSERDALAETLMSSLKINNTSRDNIYTLSYRDVQPEQAKRVVQSLVSIFVESNLGDSRKDSESARKFLDKEIAGYEKKLEEAEARLKEFKLRNLANETSEGKDHFSRMSTAGALLEQSRLELREAEQSRDALKRQLLGEEPVLLPEATQEPIAGVSIPEIDSRIDALQRNMDAMLQRFTEKHPDVVSTRRLIKELEVQKQEEIVARRKSALANPTASVNSSPVYQQLKVSLSETEARIAALLTRVAEYQARYDRLKSAIALVPQLEAEFTQLNRDYEINKKNYEQLVQRRESASLGSEMDNAAGVDFRLIDPPRASPKPVAPNRTLFLPLTMLLALIAGVAVTFAASQLRPVFFDARALREACGLPLLGTVSLLADEARKGRERKDLLRFAAACISFVGVYGAGLLVFFVLSARTA